MTSIDVDSKLSYDCALETTFLFQVAVMANAHQRIAEESIDLQPASGQQLSLNELQTDAEGNRRHRLVAPPGQFTLHYRARIELDQDEADPSSLDEKAYADLPADVLPFLNPSRYCESDRLAAFAWNEFGSLPPGHGRVQAIVDWVNGSLSYTPGSTGPSTTACDVLLQRTGVCRDYAHVVIALCRSLGVPARYVSGYAVDLQPPDFHGFTEVWLGGDWFLFDATRLAPLAGLVRIGVGRDAADVSFATLIGQAMSQPPQVTAVLAGDGGTPEGRGGALSSA